MVTIATFMTAAITVGVAISTGIATVILAILFDRFGKIDNTQTGLAGAFHLSYCGHQNLSSRYNELMLEQAFIVNIITSEQIFRYVCGKV